MISESIELDPSPAQRHVFQKFYFSESYVFRRDYRQAIIEAEVTETPFMRAEFIRDWKDMKKHELIEGVKYNLNIFDALADLVDMGEVTSAGYLCAFSRGVSVANALIWIPLFKSIHTVGQVPEDLVGIEPKYAIIEWNQGDDRWLATLLIDE